MISLDIPSTSDRIHFVDSLRSVLMMMGIVLHSAGVFDPQHSWTIQSNTTADFAGYLVQAIHFFRMQSFFLVAGIFYSLTLNKYGPRQAFRLKMTRILVPMIATILSLNILRHFVLVQSGWGSMDLVQFFLTGKCIGQTWFLLYLLLFFAITSVFFLVPGSRTLLRRPVEFLRSQPLILLILLFPAVPVFIMFAYWHGFPLYFQIPNIFYLDTFFHYLPFFIFGYFLGGSRNLLSGFSRVDSRLAVLLLAGSLLVRSLSQPLEGLWSYLVFAYFDNLSRMAVIMIGFNLFYRFFNRNSNRWRFLSEASYTMYLFSPLIIVLLGLAVINAHLPPLPGLLVLIPTALAAALLIHKYMVCKSALFSFLFNGKRIIQSKPRPISPEREVDGPVPEF